ncbi:glycoside hydrolase family 15 protein [Proteobacteria bacterium 005FR1]|nr:glycoside hydrolase family 15 protein [Proteobacteria bacterium 005FR1]
MASETRIRDLALIGNRRTTAAIDRQGKLCWYCPGRFDQPSLFASLLDQSKGAWSLRFPSPTSIRRHYVDESAILRTRIETDQGSFELCDWMTVDDGPERLCRLLEQVTTELRVEIAPRPDYGNLPLSVQQMDAGEDGSTLRIGKHYLHASLSAEFDGERIIYEVPANSSAWFVLSESQRAPRPTDLDSWYSDTRQYWNELHRSTGYEGPYENEVKNSLRALRLLTNRDSGGVIAAATFGLPEVPGGKRNYDYRYVWLRDAGMIVSALTRAGSDGKEERRFLEFLCAARHNHDGEMPLPPFVTLDGGVPPRPTTLPWRGYKESRPVIVGNAAGRQLQLDGLANVLLAAKLIYNAHNVREHWEVVAEIADYIADHWHEADHGIWEEGVVLQYTTSKVSSAVALHFIADHAGPDEVRRAQRWRQCAEDIRHYVAENCLTSDGAYAVAAGSEAVDVSAVLFPVWAYCDADSPEMQATLASLEKHSSPDGLLYRRHLECDDANNEGVFLAGSLWVAQYWIMRNELGKTRAILDAVLRYSSDLGFFAEEGDPASGDMLGNFPQSFVHAALIGLLVDYRAALEQGA